MKMKKNIQKITNGAVSVVDDVERLSESNSIPENDALNGECHPAYAVSDEILLLSMLNTLTLNPQYYRSEEGQIRELRDVLERVASKDPYLAAQMVCWSRNVGEKMRSVNHLAAALLAPFVSGKPWGSRFYGAFDRKTQSGGCVYRPDDMSEIKDAYAALTGRPLSSAMRKGFASAIEGMDNYQLSKYKKTIIDICNVAHPNSKKSNARTKVKVNDTIIAYTPTIDAVMRGQSVSADTWEHMNSKAGQEVAEAVTSGAMSKEEAETALSEMKNENWRELLSSGRLGMLAALRNVRSILNSPDDEVVGMLCGLLSDGDKIRKSGVMPYHIDAAHDVVTNEFDDSEYKTLVINALENGYKSSLPNLRGAMKGRTLVMLDCSGSMSDGCVLPNGKRSRTSCLYKGSLIASTIVKACDADLICFGSIAKFENAVPEEGVFEMARRVSKNRMGGTYFSTAFDLARKEKRKYDRIIVISDNMCNGGLTREAYREYVRSVCSPYMYCVDLACYGTTQLKGDKVANYFGCGYTMFEDISRREFDAETDIEKVRKYVI